jgi:hypothetical protein
MVEQVIETAVCRGCGAKLTGRPYRFGGKAYDPITKKECPVNHYGGFVCSRECDVRASVRLLDSMPGCAGAKNPDCFAQETINRNWNK